MAKTINIYKSYDILGSTISSWLSTARQKRGLSGYVKLADLPDIILDIGVEEQTFVTYESSTITADKKYVISGQTLSDICNNLRTKLGSSSDIDIDDIADLIDEIPGGVADLTGTTWYFNQSLDITGMSSSYALTGESGSGLAFTTIYFYVIGELHYPFTYTMAFSESGLWAPGLFEDGWGRHRVPKGAFTADETERNVTISGGTDATNSQLIEWFQSNATQIS